MKKLLTDSLAILLVTLFTVSPLWATCGGGGGGGGGGSMSGGAGGSAPIVYNVPWKIWAAKDQPAKGLILYWFPANNEELQKSSLKASRILSLYSAQCIAMAVADYRLPELQQVLGDSKPPVAVLATPDGSAITRVENKGGYLKVDQVEKALEGEMKQRENALESHLKNAREKEKAGDNTAAIALLRPVVEEKCLFPKKAKEAAKELKKLGVAEIGSVPTAPVLDAGESARIEQVMFSGLKAELAGRYIAAEKLYSQAQRMDRADPTPLRYLGELYRGLVRQRDRWQHRPVLQSPSRTSRRTERRVSGLRHLLRVPPSSRAWVPGWQ